MPTNLCGLLLMFCSSSTERVLRYTFPQFVCLLFVLGIFAFLFLSDDKC